MCLLWFTLTFNLQILFEELIYWLAVNDFLLFSSINDHKRD